MAEREDISYLSDIAGLIPKPASAAEGNLAAFGADRTIQDSGKKPTDFASPDDVSNAVQTALAEVLAALTGQYSMSAYVSGAWEPDTYYLAGDFCMNEGVGYRCKTEHTSGAYFLPTNWEVVLTSSGRAALDAAFGSFPSYDAIREIERALDDILADGGTGTYEPGIFLPDQYGALHKVTLLKDEDGEVNVAVEKEEE